MQKSNYKPKKGTKFRIIAEFYYFDSKVRYFEKDFESYSKARKFFKELSHKKSLEQIPQEDFIFNSCWLEFLEINGWKLEQCLYKISNVF